jgi:hypothetical protein
LDKWIIKTPKTGEISTTTPKTCEKKQSGGSLRQSSAAKGKLLGFSQDQYIPSILIPRAKSPQSLGNTQSLSTNTKITFAEIERLEHAPIIVDLESSEGEPSSDSHSAQLKTLAPTPEVEKLNGHQSQDPPVPTSKQNNDLNRVQNGQLAAHSNGINNSGDSYQGMPVLKPEIEIDQKSPQGEGCENSGQKRPATSPLAPAVQPKQPRRVQLITLSTHASDSKKTD